MKKVIQLTVCIVLIAVLLGGCGIDLSAEAEPFVWEMMTALEEGDADAAAELMHPEAREQIANFDEGIKSLIQLVNGRGVEESKRTSVHVNNEMGNNAEKREEGSFRAVMTDGSVLEIEYVYVKNNKGTGFLSFYLSVGT